MLILGHREVHDILDGQEAQVVEVVRGAYQLHDRQETSVPLSTFLRFPGNDRDRIIGLPSYVGGDVNRAGIKWISSFPGNIDSGLERANAAILLNSMRTGRPQAVIEGSVISAKRTAASAALAATVLTTERKPSGVTLFGCGVINLEVLRFLASQLPSLRSVLLYDSDRSRAAAFAQRCGEVLPGAVVAVAASPGEALSTHRLISIATTAARPHMGLSECAPGSTVLHLSLRDLHPKAILDAQNVVDDPDHVCRERTSLHFAERATDDRSFIDATIGALLNGHGFRPDANRVTVFSPFGLGALDIALADHVLTVARARDLGTRIDGFLPGRDRPAGMTDDNPEE